jgi:hypothetical protein
MIFHHPYLCPTVASAMSVPICATRKIEQNKAANVPAGGRYK